MSDVAAAVLAKIAATRAKAVAAMADKPVPAAIDPVEQFRKDIRLVFAFLRRGFLSPDEAQREFDREVNAVQGVLHDKERVAERFAYWRERAAEVERDLARSERIANDVREERRKMKGAKA